MITTMNTLRRTFMNTIVKMLCVCVLAGACIGVYAKSGAVQEVGVGTRAFSMANNYVAISQDQSAVYWNPGALAFLPVREFQISADILSNHTQSDFEGQQASSNMQRLRIPSIGFMTAVPTSQGGLTFAVAFQSPYTFDYNRNYNISYPDQNSNSISSQRNIRTYGNLNSYTAAMGVQVAPGLGLGVAVSLVAGTEKYSDLFTSTYNDTAATSEDNSSTASYIGYDARIGLMYEFEKIYKVGARLVFPSTINFDDKYTGGTNKGLLQSSFSGALGASASYPFMTVSSELRLRAPYDIIYPDQDIPETSDASRLNVGAGIGFEVPFGTSGTFFRCGYSFDQYDAYTFAKKDDTTWHWDNEGITTTKDRQLITGGFGYTSKSFSIEAGYGMQFWKLNNNGTLSEEHDFSRFSLSMSFRY